MLTSMKIYKKLDDDHYVSYNLNDAPTTSIPMLLLATLACIINLALISGKLLYILYHMIWNVG